MKKIKEKLEGVDEYYHTNKLKKEKDDLEIHKYRWKLIDEQKEDEEKIKKLKHKIWEIQCQRVKRGKWIVQADERARELLEKGLTTRK